MSARMATPAQDAHEEPPALQRRHASRRLNTVVIVVVSLAVIATAHVAGRVAAFCSPHTVDSLTYAISAHRLWQPSPTVHDLVPDKPPGQAMLTGWVFQITDAPPSRATLLPIETAFMAAAYLLFALVARRFFGWRVALPLTAAVAIAINVYNATDSTTDGFNLGENYAAAAILLAVWAHLCVRRPSVGGLLTGVGLGLALVIKQTAIAATAAILVHGVVDLFISGCWRDRFVRWECTLIGMVLAVAPVGLALHRHELLRPQVQLLREQSQRHFELHALTVPDLAAFWPMTPLLLWMLIGVIAVVFRVRGRQDAQTTARVGESMRATSAFVFALIWLACEAAMAWAMTKPAEHYAQLVVPAAGLVAGFGASAFIRAAAQLRASQRVRCARFAIVTTVALVFAALVPLLALARHRAGTFDIDAERVVFREQLRTASLLDRGSP